MRRAFDDPFTHWPWPRGQGARRRAWDAFDDPRPAPVAQGQDRRAPRVPESPPQAPPSHEAMVSAPEPEPVPSVVPDVPPTSAEPSGPAAWRVAQARVAYEQELARAKERIARDAERQVEIERRRMLEDFIEVLDDLDRALEARGPEGAMHAGVEMVRDHFLNKLHAHGVTRMQALGEPFDPRLHEAAAVTPVAPEDADRVMTVMRHGYAIGEDVLRPAVVVVGRA